MLTLIQFNPDEKQKPQTYRLAGDRAHLIGRRHGDVQLLDSRISRQHAEVSVQNGTWVIRDLSSSNGTWVNGDRVEGLCELEEGDRLVLGRVTLIVGHVEAKDTPEESSAPLSHATAIDVDALEAELAEPAEEVASGESELDADLVLEPMELDFDGDPDEANADDAAASVAELEAEIELTEPEIDLEPASTEAADQPIDLHDSAGASSIDLGVSSHLPAPAAEDALDPHEEDEYAAAMDFISPVVSRPESPLDTIEASDEVEAQGELDDGDPDAADEAVVGKAASNDAGVDDDASEIAPEVVGLSLDLPAPETEADDDLVSEALADTGLGEASIDEVLASADDASDESIEDWLDETSAPDTVAHDAANGEASAETTAEISEDVDPQEPADADAAKREPDSPRDPDWAEPEAQQEINAAWSNPRGSRGKKGLAVLVLVALVAGVAYWAINNAGDANTPITGSSSDTNTSATAPPTQDSGDDSTATPSILNPTTDALPLPAPPVLADLPDDDADVPETPAANAFGQAPTLVEFAPDSSATPSTSPETTPEPDTNSTPETATAATPQPTPAAITDPTPVEVEAPAADGSALAMLEPTPTSTPTPNRDPFNTPLLNVPDPQSDLAPHNPAVSANARQIVFVVDASGSMVDSMNSGALAWLNQTLQGLSDQDRFTVLFFRSNEVIEIPPVGLKTADHATRQRVLDWAAPASGNIRPRGKSEPLNAVRQAQAYQPTDIYLLSDDKFGQRRSAASIEAQDLEPLLGNNPATVHAVQFFYQDPDDARLESIAQQFGGTYEFVKEPPFDTAPGRDLGVDLIGLSR